MFAKVNWIVTWLLALLTAPAAMGILNAVENGDVLMPEILGGAMLVLWLCVVWAVAQLQPGVIRLIYLGGCIFLVSASFVYFSMPMPHATAGADDVVDVSRIVPEKAR